MRILLVGVSNMLFYIVNAALGQSRDFVVVGNIGEHEDIPFQIRRTNADAVIIQSRRPGAARSIVPLLHDFPDLTVVAIGPTGRGFVHQLRPYKARIAELSVDALRSALRTGSG